MKKTTYDIVRSPLDEITRRHEKMLLDPSTSKEVKELCYDTLVLIGKIEKGEDIDLSSERIGDENVSREEEGE